MKENIISKKQQAIEWWVALSPFKKLQICNTNVEIVGLERQYETLLGREVEELFTRGYKG